MTEARRFLTENFPTDPETGERLKPVAIYMTDGVSNRLFDGSQPGRKRECDGLASGEFINTAACQIGYNEEGEEMPITQMQRISREMHADSDYGQMWLTLYEQIVRYRQYVQGADYPALVNHRYIMNSSPIPRWDTPKLHQAQHLTLLAAGREKRLYAVPPYTDVRPLEFSDVPFQVEDQQSWACRTTGARHKFMNELPQTDGTSTYE
ncbi:MAG: hypothetical protein HC914_22285, partial [Chloroflexaceae bacterium]|nr:hypothetical protein [Chloroflexaceae bacterium]